jgi:hypothetical protein
MKYAIGMHVQAASLTLTKALVRAAAVVSTVVALGVTSFGLAGPGLVGGAGLLMATATPVHARCLMPASNATTFPTLIAWKHNEQVASGTCSRTLSTQIVLQQTRTSRQVAYLTAKSGTT